MTLLLVGFLSTAEAADSKAIAVTAPACACDPRQDDELEGPGQINFGAFHGLCVDTCRYRQSMVTSGSNKSTVTTTNYMHDQKYWQAQIPVPHVLSVDVGFEEFMPGIYHVFLLFHFGEQQPVRLSSQGARLPSAKTLDLVISAEGIPPKAGKYNFFDAYMERYPIGIRMLSKNQMVSWSVIEKKHPVQIYPLQITQAQTAELLRRSLSSVEAKSFRMKYGLFSNNCATNVADWIDEVIKPDVLTAPIYFRLFYPLERALPIAGPLGTRQILVSRHLIDEGKRRSL